MVVNSAENSSKGGKPVGKNSGFKTENSAKDVSKVSIDSNNNLTKVNMNGEPVSKGKGSKKPGFSRSKNLLIIGLGNPGLEYDNTRHNIGFRVLDEFTTGKKVPLKFTSKFNADYGAVRIGDKNVGLLKPGTFINNSGGPIRKIMEHFKLTAKDILIIADDIDLDCGDLRMREKGSHGGHNGHRGSDYIISIYYCLPAL
jgi:hypothetical protein